MDNSLLENYQHIAGKEAIDRLQQLAFPLQSLKVIHLNSTQQGGGVAEILTKMVPLAQALGIHFDWQILQGSTEFFRCTKQFHNAIQGNKILIPQSQYSIYEENNKHNAERLASLLNDADIVFIHDPQPVSLISHFPQRKGKWVWRCHIDASKPFRPVWKYLMKHVIQYDASIFSLADFTHPLPNPMFLIPPSIDPLSEKNIDLSPKEIEKALEMFNIDPTRPKILQVSRFDRFKDPIGVIESYTLSKKFTPSLQLILAGGEAPDDPESELVIQEVTAAAADDPDIHILVLPPNAHQTINALQRGADIVIQKSIREGFGLTVTEALWKNKPVIGGNTGGIKLQIINGQTGFLVNTPEGAAYRIRYLLQNRNKIEEMGIKGKEFVREKFLITRHLQEYLTLIHSLLNKNADRIELAPHV